MNKLLITLFSFLAIAVVSCSDDDEPKMPTNAIALNMMIGDSETTIGGSDVFINASNTVSYTHLTSHRMIVELQTSVEKEVSIRTQIYRSLPRRLRLRPAISTRLFLPTRFRQLPETGHFLSTPTTTTFMLIHGFTIRTKI